MILLCIEALLAEANKITALFKNLSVKAII